VNTHTHYINGKWTPSADESTLDVRNPYDDSLYAQAAAGTAAEADLAVTAADSAFPAWAELGAERKQEHVPAQQRSPSASAMIFHPFSHRRPALRIASASSNKTS
jgi:hypothetical protein